MRTQNFVLSTTLMTLSVLYSAGAVADPATQFSPGPFSLPEAIVATPPGFGPSGTGYVVPDPSVDDSGSGILYTVPTAGGPSSPLVNFGTGFLPIGGTFLGPAYGGLGGQFLAVGLSGTQGAVAQTVNGSGVATPLFTSSTLVQFNSAVTAPTGFGTIGGQVLISDSTGNVDLLATSGTSTSVFTKIPPATGANAAEAFGLGFAPTGFGSIAGDLLVGDAVSGDLYAVNAAGDASLFATISLQNAVTYGLRQFAFAPEGFGTYGGDLFVSVSGSANGGGSLGQILVLNDNGNVIADFDQGTSSSPLDPRGLYFPSPDILLIANADPQILEVGPGNFAAVPEPGTLLVLSTALGLLAFQSKRRHASMPRGCT